MGGGRVRVGSVVAGVGGGRVAVVGAVCGASGGRVWVVGASGIGIEVVMATSTMNISDFFLTRLKEAGITHVFGVYGSSCSDLIDAFHRVGGITFVPFHTEQNCGYAAEAYAKMHGPFGVVIATSGPGAQNLIAPIANCYYDSVPVLFLTGQVSTQFQRRNSTIRNIGFQECPITEIVSPITKWAEMLTKPESARKLYEFSVAVMLQRRRGPVLLDLPIDVQRMEVPSDIAGYVEGLSEDDVEGPIGSPEVETFASDFITALAGSKRPAILVGGGVRSSAARSRLYMILRHLKVPTFPTWNAIDVIPDDHACFAGRIGTYGGKGRNFAVQNADLVLILGSRISGRIMGGAQQSFLRGAKTFWVDYESSCYGSDLEDQPLPIHIDRQLACGLESYLRVLHRQICVQISKCMTAGDSPSDFSAWMVEAKRLRDHYDPVVEMEYRFPAAAQSFVQPYSFCRILSQETSADAIITHECGGNAVIVGHCFETKQGQRVISNHGNSPMGGGFGYGLGAAIANPTCPVICIVGDGGFQAGGFPDLQTLITHQERLKTLKVFIFNNHSLGITRAYQRTNLGGRYIACGPDRKSGYSVPDFCAVLSAFGVKNFRINGHSVEVWRETIRAVLAAEGPIVVDVDMGTWDEYAPRIAGWGAGIEEMLPAIPKGEFLRNMSHVPPLDGWESRRGQT